ncbi:MAG TPA: DUF5666 domain-containing protein [Vicinamibacterales bacterium]|nr:DUF5666 domain-containing protein [Vicinamibacterales bacterium]
MVRHLGRAALGAAIGVTLACGSTSTSSINGPSATKCQVTVNGGNVSFPPQGGNGSVTVSTERECSWSAQAAAGWIHLAASGGQGDGTIPFTVERNVAYSARSGAIQVSNGGSVQVQQEPLPPPPPPPPAAPAPGPGPAPSPNPSPAPAPDAGRNIDLKGEIGELSGLCPLVQFTLSRRLVRTTAATDFRLRCDDLRNGRDVAVKGVVQADGSVLATRIQKN